MFSKAFWRDVRFLQVLAQILFVILLAILAGFLYANVKQNLASLGLTVGYGFLDNPASFDIGEKLISYQPSDSYGRAIVVGIVNTLSVSILGVVFATVLGIVAGVARLSSNWLVNKLAASYVGIIRNTPLIIQLMFWYFGIILQLPNVRDAVALPGSIFLTRRGVFIPWVMAGPTYDTWVTFIWLAIIAFIILWLVFNVYTRPSGVLVPLWAYSVYLIIPALILWGGYALQPQAPLLIDMPILTGLNFKGGKTLTPEFAALIAGLVMYTGAFIAEIVRAGIQSVSKGQVEAARALGLNNMQTLRLVVFPQAMRVIIPPLTSQYLNLAKNSSLAIAIGYPDLFSIAGTVFNQTGAAIEIIMIMMVSYLSISLFTSFFMNIYNTRMRLVER